MEIYKDVENSPFKDLETVIFLGKKTHGTPHFFPRNHVNWIFSLKSTNINKSIDLELQIRKFQLYNQAWKSWKFTLFNRIWSFSIGTPITYKSVELGWKDKFNSPRYEFGPSKHFYFFRWECSIFYKFKRMKYMDDYWEQYLWYKYYSDEDIEKARKTWPWTTDGISTWKDRFLK